MDSSEVQKAFRAHLDLCCRNYSFYQCSPFSVQCYRSISAKCQIMRKYLPIKAFECVHTTCILKYVFPIFSNFSENTLNIFEGKTLIFNMQIMTCRIYLNVDRIMCTHQPFHSHALKKFKKNGIFFFSALPCPAVNLTVPINPIKVSMSFQ